MSITKVLITGAAADAPVPLTVNGQRYYIPRNVPTPIPDEYLPALRDSSFSFSIVTDEETDSAAPDGEAGGGGAEGTGAAADSSGDDTAADDTPEVDRFDDEAVLKPFLDRSVQVISAELAGLNRSELRTLRDAEEGGKTRSSLVTAIDAALAALAPAA